MGTGLYRRPCQRQDNSLCPLCGRGRRGDNGSVAASLTLFLPDCLGSFKAIESRHLDVHQHEVEYVLIVSSLASTLVTSSLIRQPPPL